MNQNKSIITSKDVLILKKLLEDGRASSSSISKEIDLGREIVNYRIKRLIKENLIVKFIPKVNEKALYYQEYIIFLKLNLEDEISKDKFIKENIGNKYLVWTVKSNKGWDLIVRLYAQNVDEFKNKLSEILETFSDVLTNYYTIISSEEIKENEKSVIANKVFDEEYEKKKDYEVIKQGQLIQIDDKDKEIINLLETDARVQYKEIANKLDVSSDTVKYRIDRMKEQGILEGITPVLNFNKLGLFQYAAILRFPYLDKSSSESIKKILNKCDCVVRAIKSLNNDEYFLNLVFDFEIEAEEFEKDIRELGFNIDVFDVFKID
ncbi:MAG: AsnC family transcriptional regulator [Nanoarchaeales archaeon]|nr:AsnC family transcriptional regulator [Nanoarchaeales archaeon]